MIKPRITPPEELPELRRLYEEYGRPSDDELAEKIFKRRQAEAEAVSTGPTHAHMPPAQRGHPGTLTSTNKECSC